MRGLRVLIAGGGGRESALLWAIDKSPFVENVIQDPCTDLDTIVRLALEERIGLVVVGPEAPLVAGLVDRLEEFGIPAFGPSAKAARLEGSKVYMKELCSEHGIPTARWDAFGTGTFEGSLKAFRLADMFIDQFSSPPVVKADGLCGGKGVVVAKTRQEASNAAHDMLMKRKFGLAGSRIVVEERLYGRECSMMFLCQDEVATPLPPARDYKRAWDGDRGLNTGGMGAYSPLPDVDDKLVEQVRQRIVLPILRAMRQKGAPFRGVLYCGLTLTDDGPYVLEFNVRFGDPETQVVLPRLESDIVPYLLAIARNEPGGLARLDPLAVSPKAAVCFTLVSKGYPGEFATGYPITGLEHAIRDNSLVFHAATRLDGAFYRTAGGRVLSVVGMGANIEHARRRAEDRADEVNYLNKYRRTDIALNP